MEEEVVAVAVVGAHAHYYKGLAQEMGEEAEEEVEELKRQWGVQKYEDHKQQKLRNVGLIGEVDRHSYHLKKFLEEEADIL